MRRIIALTSLLALAPHAACAARSPLAASDGGTVSDAQGPPPKADASNVQPPTSDPCARWTCIGAQPGDTCRADFATLPPFASSTWRCHQARGAWHCDGRSPVGGAPVPPPPICSDGWSCKQIGVAGSSPNGQLPYPGYDTLHRCSRPIDARDMPPGLKHAVACVRGSAFGGTRCEILDQLSGGPPPPPDPSQRCKPGQRRWCEGLQYSGWGIIACTAEGFWPTTTVNGRKIVDCQELADGRRPDNLCACYHFYPNLSCCERLDCIVATRDDGSTSEQVCGKSEGKLCDYCSPAHADCAPDATCVVTNSGESYCAAACTDGQSCPAGNVCVDVKNQAPLCVPANYSCYY